MISKKFINTESMQGEILELLQKEFLAKQFYGDKIEIKLDLKDIINKKMEEQHIQEPLVYITVNAYQKILTLVKEFSSEVAWHSTVEHITGTNAYLITDVLVFPQEVTGATANSIDGEYEMWLASQPDEIFEKIRCHMHSHVNMGTSPSTVDEHYRMNLLTQVTDYYMFMIVNKKSEYTLRFYDVVNNIVYDDMNLIICFEDGTPLSHWYESVKDAVKEKTYTAPSILTKTDNTLSEWDKKWGRDGNPYDDYDEYYKKKETTTQAITKGRGRPKKNERSTNADKFIYITGPDNIQRQFISIDWAINFIYNQYPDNNYKFSKNNMRKFLAKNKSIVYDGTKGDFDYDFLDRPGGLEYAILKCDLWEVTECESK